MRQTDRLKDRARAMRREASPAERSLWLLLRAHRLNGAKFTRQTVIGSYIVDFAARAGKLAVEVDGDSHAAQTDYDAARTVFLERQGYRVIRFSNADVLGNPDGVLSTIVAALDKAPLPTLSPGGRGL